MYMFVIRTTKTKETWIPFKILKASMPRVPVGGATMTLKYINKRF